MGKLVKGSYEEWRYNLSGRGWNKILYAVTCKTPKEELDLKNEFEERLYDETWQHAEEHLKKYGFWPAFELAEIEWDDPVLDIYKDSAEEWSKERKAKKE